MSLTAFTLTLDSGATARAVQVPPDADLSGLAEALALPPCNGTLAVVGGAAGLDDPEFRMLRAQVRRLLDDLVHLAKANRLAVIDGGTPFGVMRLLGQARADLGGRFPLIGVAPLGKVTWPDRPSGEGDQTPLDPHHSAFVLVETDDWGGEADTLAAVACTLAGEQPTVEILIEGGEVARRDVWAYLQRGGQVVAIEGSGRFADDLAGALRRGHSDDLTMRAMLATGRVYLFSLNSPPGAVIPWLRDLVGWPDAGP
jgi:hypothetical protein